ncbi:MAG TPA: hypothetical protein VGO11_14685 [Chthoniobacteraceae bacterium]|jgi:hypothetical protein|nr:hypothetical protein [Chthoniobacteraceae bacterium]
MYNSDDAEKALQDDLLDLTIIGASHLANGKTDFASWSAAMMEEGYPSIRKFLPMLFHNSTAMLLRMREIYPE